MSFPRNNKGPYKRRDVPHWDYSEATQHISFRLSDSLPQNQLERFKKQVEEYPPLLRSTYLHREIEDWIHQGAGSCILSIPELAQCVIDTLNQSNEKCYHLYQWVVMPNHIHVLINEFPQNPLGDVVKSWKHYTSMSFDKILHNLKSSNRYRNGYIENIINTFHGNYWIVDYWDVMIQSNRQFRIVSKYIANNPVKAGLVDKPEDYPWSSSYRPR
ncbi:MAG: transposase [Thermoguttaceae bacterium]|nr:transposase [Thermoguttaceae bacterium]